MLTDITYRRLDRWCERGIIRPSKRNASGKGQRRLFTFRDVVEVGMLKKLTDCGVRLSALTEAVNNLRREVGRNGVSALASSRLVTNGKTVFRYVPGENHLESLDGYGQFGFAFGVGDEISALILRANRLDLRSRYTRSTAKQKAA